MTAANVTPPGGPAAPVPNRHTGFYETPLGPMRSVTTILDTINKPALFHWSAREVAACAIDHLPYLARLRGRPAREQAFTWLRKAAERKRDTAGELGTAIHLHAQARILGTPMPEPTEDQAPYVAAFDRFLADWMPVYEATELVVANTAEGYGGTCDAWIRLPDNPLTVAIIDYKTGRGVWGEAPLQVASYNRCDVGWLKNGTQVVPPHADRGFVLHLRPDAYPEGYALLPVDIGDETYAQFLHAKALDDGAKHRRLAVGKPATPPVPPALPDLTKVS
jgi:hypothetical protein